jgi:hypothetical protein
LTSPSKRSPLRIALSIARTLLGVLLLAWVLSRPDTAEAVRSILTSRSLIAALFAMGFLGVVFEALRLTLLFRSQAIPLGLGESFRIVTLGAFFNYAVPGSTGGDVMKLWYLARDRAGRRVEVATVLAVDRFVALFSMLSIVLLLAASDVPLVREHAVVQSVVWAAALGWVVLLVGAVIASSPRLWRAGFVQKVLDRLPLSRFVIRGLEALHRFRSHGRAVLGAFLVSGLGHMTLLCLFIVSASVLLPDVPASRVCLLSLLGLLVNALPITPGGIGVGETAFDELFRTAGHGAGSPLILAWRAAQIPVFVVGGLFYAAGVRRDRSAREGAANKAVGEGAVELPPQ